MRDPGNALFGFVGNTQGTEIENTITYLKAARMLKHLQTRAITKNTLLDVLSEVNSKVVAKFTRAIPSEITVATAADPSKTYGPERGTIYCEDRRLSLETPGVQYKCLDLKKIQARRSEVVELTHEEVMLILDCCASFLDVEAVECNTPSLKATYWRLDKSRLSGTKGKATKALQDILSKM